MTVLIDSSAWIEYFRGGDAGETVAEHLEGDEEIVISAINLYEVHVKSLLEEDKKRAEQKIAFMLNQARLIDVGENIATEAAELRKDKGLHMADALVYTTAKLSSATLLTCDRHFEHMENVQLLI